MTTASISPLAKQQFNQNGIPLAGGKLFTYVTGTSTKQTTYSNSSLTANQNPIILDANGQCDIWLDDTIAYRFVLAPSTDTDPPTNPYWTEDNITSQNYSNTSLKTLLAASTGSSLVGWIQSFASSVARLVRDKLRESVSVKDFGAVGDGVTDDTAAIQAAINATANGLLRIYFPVGTYKVTSQITISKDRIYLYGEGVASRILFLPTADGVCFLIDNGSTSNVQGQMRDLTFYSTDTTYAKTAIKAIDISQWIFNNIQTISPHWFGGTGSKGLWILGRDTTGIKNFCFFADYPIYISPIPAPHTSGGIGIDHFDFNNIYIGSGSGFGGTLQKPLITIESAVNLTQVSFSGFQAWVGGAGGLYWVDTTSNAISNGLYIENVRYEGSIDPTKYFINIQHNTGLQNLTVKCGQAGVSKGIYLRKVTNVNFDTFYYTDATREALNADSTVFPIITKNCFWQTGSTSTLTGLSLEWALPSAVSGPVRENGYYGVSSDTSTSTTVNATQGSDLISLAQNAVTSIGTATQCGIILITCRTTNATAIYSINGTSQTTTEIADPANRYSNTANTATSYNLYWSAANSRYELQNTNVATSEFEIARFGFV